MANRAIVTWVAFEAPAVQGAVTAAAPALPTLALSVHAPSVTAGSSATFVPVLLTLTATLHQPAVSTNRSVVAQPSQQTLALTLSAPAVSNQSNVTRAPAQLTLALTNSDAPTIGTGTGATVVVGQVSLASSVLAPTVAAARTAVVQPGQQALALALTDPSVSAGGSVAFTADIIILVASAPVPTASVVREVAVPVQPVDLVASIPDPPVVVVDATSSASVGAPLVELALVMPAPTIMPSVGVTVQPNALQIVVVPLPPTIVGLPADQPGVVGVGIVDVADVGVGVVPTLGGGEMPDVGDMGRFGNAATDPATGQPLASPPAAFTTGGVAADPTTVTILVRKMDGTVLEYGWPAAGPDGPALRESVGRFYVDVEYDQSGNWRCRIEGTGAVKAAAEGSVRVSRQRVLAA